MNTKQMADRQSELIKDLIVENARLRKENELLEEVGCYGFEKFIQVTVVMGICLVISVAFNVWG